MRLLQEAETGSTVDGDNSGDTDEARWSLSAFDGAECEAEVCREDEPVDDDAADGR